MRDMDSNDLFAYNVMQSHLSTFTQTFLLLTVHDLNWNVKQAWKNLRTIGILSNKDSWCFSSNTSCVPPQSVSVLATIKDQSVIYQSTLTSVDVVTKVCYTYLGKGMRGLLLHSKTRNLTRFATLILCEFFLFRSSSKRLRKSQPSEVYYELQ